jgi:ABC-type Fe3+-hydroxamate transport system substrate-binding protein
VSRTTLAVIAALAVTVACGGSTSEHRATAAPFVDPEGRPIAVAPLPVHRIVSTMQTATEWLVTLGAQDRLVARTEFDRQPELASLPSIGGGLDPSPEAVAALRPDVVIGWRNRSSSDLLRALAPFHIPVVSFETTDTSDIFLNLRRIGALVGAEAKADSLAEMLRTDLRSIQAEACPDGPASAPTVFLEVGTEPPMTTGGGTWMNTILRVVCLRNLFADLEASWPTVSLEAIAARNPDWILTSRGPAPGARLADLRSKAGWRDLPAVKAGRIIEIPADLFSRGGPTIADAARAILASRRATEGH